MRKLITVFVIALPFFLGFSLANPHFNSNRFQTERKFQITYTAHLADIPKNAASLKIWVPLGGNREGQRVLNRKISTPGAFQVTVDPEYQNEMVYFEASAPFPKELDFKIDYTVQVSKDHFLRENKGEEAAKYLRPSRFMVVTPEIRNRTQLAIQGRRSALEIAKGIYDYVIQHMVYEKTTPGWGRGDSLRACLLGRGNCTDFHSLFISMAHAAEVPARFKIGFVIPDGTEGEIEGYHCWAEFYEAQMGWRPVDASEAWKRPERKKAYFGNFDTNKFLISVGRDIELVPKQAGPPVNIFFYPYVEVDGKEWNGVKTSFQFKNLRREA